MPTTPPLTPPLPPRLLPFCYTQVSNEDQLLAALGASFPTDKLVVFDGYSSSVPESIELFRRAKVVVGMHGAGLSHAIFSAPGTAVIEMLFMQ